VVERAARELLDGRFVVARRRAQDAGGVAQLRARQELGVVAQSADVDQPAQGVSRLVALEAHEHGRRHGEHEELAAEQVGRQRQRGFGVDLGPPGGHRAGTR
jgi:hypothetical protein